jgi:predicted NBD/HSP70 family sugar kinase
MRPSLASAAGLSDFVCITLGTGVGGGCYAGGRLNRGSHFFANAFGHITIEPGGRECNCGRRGCLETYSNAGALLGCARGRYASPGDLIRAAHDGEQAARDAIREFSSRLAIGCSILVQILDPNAIIVAGGLVEDNAYLLATLQAELPNLVTVWAERRLRLIASGLGYYAGVFGTGAVALQNGLSTRNRG